MNEPLKDLNKIEKKRRELLSLELLVLSFLTVSVIILSLLEQKYLTLFFLIILTTLFSAYIINKQRELKKLDADLTEEQFRNIEERMRAASLQEKLKEVTLLYRVGRINVSSLTLQKKLDKMLRLAYNMVKAHRASIMLINERMGNFVVASSIGIYPDIIGAHPQRVDEGVAGWVCKHKTSLILSGRVNDDRFYNFKKKSDDISSAICLPIKLKGKVIGVLNLNYLNEQERVFNEHDLRLLSFFARYISTTIEYTQISLKKPLVHT
ncbi:MAG: hypothetical protein A2Z47_12460 [Thermodesulfovibrio sp. RBG_19FT_COMBO_42_12]|nr:MAG: hypothetical protein A2Z47_12460 [Thermodesulfovibrio sp. RBG_19FT_COMBO_42_12]